MMKFLFTLTLLPLLFLGFSYFSKYDIPVQIFISGYLVETSGLFLIVQFLLNLFLFSFIIFLVKKVISSPYLLYSRYISSRDKSDISSIINAATSIILGDAQSALKLGNKLLNSENQRYKNFATAIMTLSPNISDQIHYLHELSIVCDDKKFLINKKMMHLFMREKNYHQAHFYGYEAFVENEHCSELYIGLIISNCKILNAEKAIFFLEKAERYYPEVIKNSSDEIADAMFQAAEELLRSKDKRDSATLLLTKLSSSAFENDRAKMLLESKNL